MEYLIIEGRRKDSQIYCAGDRIYQKKSNISLGIRLRCAQHETCPGEAYICKDLHKVCCDKAHTCAKDPLMKEEILFKNNLKRLVITRLDLTVPKVFQLAVDELNKPEVAARVKLTSVQANLSRIRKKFKSQMKNNGDDNEEMKKSECAICFVELKENPIVNVPCGHGFCRKCSDAALKIKKTCSVCRKKVKETVEYFKTYMFVLSYLWDPSHFNFNILFLFG